MFPQLIKQYIRTSSHRINSFRIDIRSLYQVRTKEQQIPIKEQEVLRQNSNVKDKSILEPKYPGYEIIYRLPHVKYFSKFNRLKYYIMLSTSVSMPTTAVLSQAGVITPAVAFTLLIYAFVTSLSVYLTGYFFNYQIGFIYYKDDMSIKIAYVDVWGKRVDIDTSIEDIKPFANSNSLTNKLYKTLHLSSLKNPLKLLAGNSPIYDKELLTHILGNYEYE